MILFVLWRKRAGKWGRCKSASGAYLWPSFDGPALRISSVAALDCCRKEARLLWEADMLKDLARAHEDGEDELRDEDDDEEERRQVVDAVPWAKLDATCVNDHAVNVVGLDSWRD